MDTKENPENDLKVEDKRRFNQDGSEKSFSTEEKPGDFHSPRQERFSSSTDSEKSSIPVSFSYLILSLAGSVQISLGISPNPVTHQLEKNLSHAKETIDLLGVLEEKTKGNLTTEEKELFEVVLADLRLRYVEEKNRL